MSYTTFATFGSAQLRDFNVNPMKVILVAEDEQELRQRLQEEPFNNQYCTTYDIKESARMQEQFDMYEITLPELLKLQK